MTNRKHVTEAMQVVAGAGITAAGQLAGIKAGTALLRELADVPVCGHPDGCTTPATHQTQRNATADEAAAHWDALERNIIESGNPDYRQDRLDVVRIAEHRCDDSDHADPLYLEAIENQRRAEEEAAAKAARGDDA